MQKAGKEEVRQTQERGHREYMGDKNTDQVGGPGHSSKQKGTHEMEAGNKRVRLIQRVGGTMSGTNILGIQYQIT